jgi:hypothetical protein
LTPPPPIREGLALGLAAIRVSGGGAVLLF